MITQKAGYFKCARCSRWGSNPVYINGVTYGEHCAQIVAARALAPVREAFKISSPPHDPIMGLIQQTQNLALINLNRGNDRLASAWAQASKRLTEERNRMKACPDCGIPRQIITVSDRRGLGGVSHILSCPQCLSESAWGGAA